MKNSSSLLLSFSLLVTLATAAPRQNPGDRKTATSQRFTFELRQCGRVGAGAACDFSIMNEGEEDRDLYLSWYDSKMVGDDGEEYTASSIQFDGSRRVYINNGVAARGRVVPGVPFNGRIRFNDVSPSVRSVNSVRLLGRVFDYKIDATFRGIPFTGVGAREIPSSRPSGNAGTFSPPTYTYERREETFTLSRINSWVNTGIEVQPNMRLVISSNGVINVSNIRSNSPDPTGVDLVIRKTWPRDSRLRERTIGAGDVGLKIIYLEGGASSVTRIGGSKYEFKPRKKGLLAIGIPQPYTGDTSGSISVLVQW